jgi:HlyD family secretion protein
MRVRRILWYALLATALVAGLVYAFRPQPVSVDLANVERGDVRVTIDGEGKTRVREVYVVSAPIAGRVLRSEHHVGDDVVANQTLLAEIQPEDPTFLDRRARAQRESEAKAAQAAFALAQADQARAVAELEFARSELKRSEELDQARLDYRSAKAALDTANATVEMRRFQLETARAALIQPSAPNGNSHESSCCVNVYAPVDGRVLRLLHESEGVVTAGTPLIEIGNPADLEVVVDLLSSDAVRVRDGADVTIVDWGGTSLSGRVRRVEPFAYTKVSALGIEEQRANVIIDFTEPREKWERLGHGYRVDAYILDWQGKEVLRVPMGALFRDGESWAVFVDEQGTAKLRHVEIGHNNGRWAEVLDGLAQGTRVVLHPGDRVYDGVRIAPRTPG